MSERQQQTEFLKTMLQFECEREDLERWQNRIHKAEREEQCVASSVRLVFLILMLAICGLGYCRLFLLGSITHSPDLLVKVFFALSIACTLCFLVFGGVWFYYRHLTNRVCAESRRHLMSLAQSRTSILDLTEARESGRPTPEMPSLAPVCAGRLAEVA